MFTYLVIENAPDVCEGIIRRMGGYADWRPLGFCTGITDAKNRVRAERPHLLFLDWGLNGGSAFELLDEIALAPDYHPYIIFFTGFQKDNPEIPVEIFNKYRVDKYLLKPVWENLRNHLSEYLDEAKEKQAKPKMPKCKFWLEDAKRAKHLIDLRKIVCIVQNPADPRCRYIYFHPAENPFETKLKWKKCSELLAAAGVAHFTTKSRGHLVTRNFIEKFDKPFIKLAGYNFRVEVVKDNMRAFERWLFGERTALLEEPVL